MNEPGTLLGVTGAAGFLGGAVTRSALAAGYRVRAILRPGSRLTFDHPHLEVRAVGLSDSPELVAALKDCQAVIHVAAALIGDYTCQHADTVVPTQQLVAAMHKADVPRLVGVSSFSVYDYPGLEDNALLDESAPLDPRPERRGAYARCKLEQEAAVRAFESAPNYSAVVVRPGLIYAEDRCWEFFLGRALGSGVWLALGPDATLPLVHVADVADALLYAAAAPAAAGSTINLVGDALPRRREFLNHLNLHATHRRRILRLPWALHRALAGAADAVNRVLFRGRGRLPGLLDPVELAVRFRPLRYNNARAKNLLGWQPRHKPLDVTAKALSDPA